MNKYVVIENGTVVNKVLSDAEYATKQGWMPAPEFVQIGWVFDGQNWSNPNKPTIEELAASVRRQRDALIAKTDWTQAADVPQATKDKWAPYRQALRDVPQQAGFPDNIQWPSKPE
jgi:hypothetical protein